MFLYVGLCVSRTASFLLRRSSTRTSLLPGISRDICRTVHTSQNMAVNEGEKSTASELTRPWGKLAFNHRPGKSPGVMFCCGYKSDKSGTKAMALEEYCVRENRSYTRFDYYGCGESGGDFHKGTLGQWKEDALDVLDNVTQGPQIIVGSSMGSWIMLLLARERPARVKALVGVASAPDFTRWRDYPDQIKQDLKTKGVAYYNTEYGEMSISQVFMEESSNHWILDKPNIDITCPIRLLHGMKDDSVPYDISQQIAKKVRSEDVDVILRKAGDHRLSTPQDIQLLIQTLDNFISKEISG